MQITDMIKLATDILASQGNLFLDIEVKGKRFRAKGIDIEKRNSTSKENILVVYGSEEDEYK